MNFVDGDNEQKIKRMKKVFKKAPLAFCSFDLKNYTTTNKGLKLFKSKNEIFLPRMITYFDHLFKSNENEGEYLSIKEFNKKSKNQKILNLLEFPEQLSL